MKMSPLRTIFPAQLVAPKFGSSAELRVKNRNDLTMGFWRSNVDQLLTFNGFDILSNTGKISNKDMEQIVGERYMVFDARRKKADAEAADREDMAELSEIEAAVIRKRGSGKKE